MAKKFYVVWAGRETGVFTSWPYTKKLVDKFPQARYKSFPTEQEAEAAFASGRVSTPRSSVKKTASKPSASLAPKTANFEVNIYCDGACDPNPGKSGSGVAVYRDGALAELWYGLYNPMGTNNTAELNALHQSLLIAKLEIEKGLRVQVLADSQYAINCLTLWAYSWKTKGWKRKVAGDIKNLELIQQAHALYDTIKNRVVVSHVKAHIGVEGNELADRMSVYGADQEQYDFCQYSDALDIEKILNYKRG